MSDRTWIKITGGTLTGAVFLVALFFVAGALGSFFAASYVMACYFTVMAFASLWGGMVLLVSLVQTVKKMKIEESK